MNRWSLRRDQWLALVLGGVALFYFAGDTLTSIATSPFASRQRTRGALERKVAEAEEELAAIEHAQRALQLANERSLPPDPSTATALYQEWLIEQAQRAGLVDAVVSPASPIPEQEIGHRIPMTIEASATPSAVGQLLEQLHRAPLLHRVTLLSLTPAYGRVAGQRLRMMAQIEALALTSCEPRSTLFPTTAPATVDSRPFALAQRVQQRKPFDRWAPPSTTLAVITADHKVPPPANPLSSIRFIGTWRTQEREEAWFLNESTSQEIVVSQRQPLRIDSLSGQLLSLTDDTVTLRVDGRQLHLTLGETLAQRPASVLP